MLLGCARHQNCALFANSANSVSAACANHEVQTVAHRRCLRVVLCRLWICRMCSSSRGGVSRVWRRRMFRWVYFQLKVTCGALVWTYLKYPFAAGARERVNYSTKMKIPQSILHFYKYSSIFDSVHCTLMHYRPWVIKKHSDKIAKFPASSSWARSCRESWAIFVW